MAIGDVRLFDGVRLLRTVPKSSECRGMLVDHELDLILGYGHGRYGDWVAGREGGTARTIGDLL